MAEFQGGPKFSPCLYSEVIPLVYNEKEHKWVEAMTVM